jgi:hypothetical protein
MPSKKFTILAFIFAAFIAQLNIVFAQDNKAVIAKKIQDGNFVFIAQSVAPSQGMIRQLSPDYDLRVSSDSVIAYLPYFGRAYSAPIGVSEGGIKFTSTKFKYIQRDRKKGGWDIIIKPADTDDVKQLLLTVFQNGSAFLQVTSVNRQLISFNGYISVPRR